MAKIRGVKPDYWTDERIVDLSIPARLLFIGLWNHACDNGHLQDKSKQIKMRILPADDVNCAELLRELETQRLIKRAGGWITIPNLSHHQKPHKRWWATCDKPGCVLPDGASHAPSNRGTTVAPPKGNRCATADSDGEGEGELKVSKNPSPKGSDSQTPDRFDEFWDAYAYKVGRKKAVTAYRAALKKPGINADLLIAAAAAYIGWQVSEGKHPKFTKHPATWLSGEHWTDERVARPQPPTRMQEHLSLVQQLAAEEANQPREIGHRP